MRHVNAAADANARQSPRTARNKGAINPYCGLKVRRASKNPARIGRRSASSKPPISSNAMNGPACNTRNEAKDAGPIKLAAISAGDCGAAIFAISKKPIADAMSQNAFAAP